MSEYQEVQLNDENLISGDKITNNNSSANKTLLNLFKNSKITKSNFITHKNKLLKKISFANLKSQSSIKVKKYDLLSKDNLNIPIRSKSGRYFKEIDSREPLIGIINHSDSEEYEGPAINTTSNFELKNQLIKDGYNLDEQSDIDDLDLIPPRSFNQSRFLCCRRWSSSWKCTFL